LPVAPDPTDPDVLIVVVSLPTIISTLALPVEVDVSMNVNSKAGAFATEVVAGTLLTEEVIV
jgi:hypothetical protein